MSLLGRICAAVGCWALLLVHVYTARAAGIVGTGTEASCTDAALDAALAGGGLVTFSCGGPATINVSTGTGTKMIAKDTTIDGGGLITISGGNAVGVFRTSRVSFTVKNLTITNGNAEECAGGVCSTGALVLRNSTISHHTPAGILGGGAIDVSNSTFTMNNGAAIDSSGTLTVRNSTFAGNRGSGIVNFYGTATASNSTFTGNTADFGAGIYNDSGPLSVTNCTFTGNSAHGISEPYSSGAAIYNRYNILLTVEPDVRVTNTILANNSGGNCLNVSDGGHNLDDDMTCSVNLLSHADAQLDPAGLNDNGGSTQTVAVCTGVGTPSGCTAASPAIEAGDNSVCAAEPVNNRDQRGFVRPAAIHLNCSIGAYEADALPASCDGDCDSSGEVTVDEIITMVEWALAGGPIPATCPIIEPFCTGAGDAITCIVGAVNNLLGGCPVFPHPVPTR